MSDKIMSVVIPAHNEEAAIHRLLQGICSDQSLEVIVVPNACTDKTAAVARLYGAVVVETDTGGKANALRLGDAHCTVFPRAYLDADIELSGQDMLSLRDQLQSSPNAGSAVCVSPVASFDTSGMRPFVARLHDVFHQLTSQHETITGVGVYTLTELGHKYVFPIPDVISDDGWVDRKLPRQGRVIAPSVRVVITPPRTFRSFILRRVRVRLGNRQLDKLHISRARPKIGWGSLIKLLGDGSVSFSEAALITVVVSIEYAVCFYRILQGSSTSWYRDSTSREG